jgi:outer membrane protein assembly factor BamD (BamD/ComL family)
MVVKWSVTDSQSCRRKAVLSYQKGNLSKAAQSCRDIARKSNSKEVKRKAKLDAFYFNCQAKRKALTRVSR